MLLNPIEVAWNSGNTLRNWLATNLPIQGAKRLVRIEEGNDGVSFYFEDNTCAKANIVVGADGINSNGRPCRHCPNLEYPVSVRCADVGGKKLIPLAAIVGQLELPWDAFKRQIELGHSGYMSRSEAPRFFNLCGLHQANPDGISWQHYWIWMVPEAGIAEPGHWLRHVSQEKLDHVLASVAALPPRLREMFERTPASGIQEGPYIWRDLQLAPFELARRGRRCSHVPRRPLEAKGGHHALIDALRLSKVLKRLPSTNYT
ncbi:hypothetical protein PG993_003102 [Apiospora rasikravindrae]|uniref:FAD-binding domain-containing protein n=1 Tax=Apiospora rasikravindrae TaxID=990691 RepID=A0ABR1TYM5_9PEZI